MDHANGYDIIRLSYHVYKAVDLMAALKALAIPSGPLQNLFHKFALGICICLTVIMESLGKLQL